MSDIKTIKIHPAIGIARVGNSPDEYFVGPEIPGVNEPPTGGYKDAQMRVKRQAARFRIFGYDENGNVVKEITAADAEIKWTLHLANKKAAWKQFDGLNTNAPLRNASEKNRTKLVIDPGERRLNKINSKALFDTGTFYDKIVPLGEMRMDSKGLPISPRPSAMSLPYMTLYYKLLSISSATRFRTSPPSPRTFTRSSPKRIT